MFTRAFCLILGGGYTLSILLLSSSLVITYAGVCLDIGGFDIEASINLRLRSKLKCIGRNQSVRQAAYRFEALKCAFYFFVEVKSAFYSIP